jgi:hypothetical protein
MSRYNHFDTYEWIGLFWTADKELEFPGKLTYTPEDGLLLDFMCPIKQCGESPYLHAVLATGEVCTLLGSFSPERAGFHLGQFGIYKGSTRFHAVIFDVHISDTETFAGLSLDLTNFQEFCHPQGFKEWAEYSKDPLAVCSAGKLTITIENTARFSYLHNGVTTLFFSDNPEVIRKIEQGISTVMKEHEADVVMQRRDIGWEFRIEAAEQLTYSEANKNITLLEELVSLLIFSPARRIHATLLQQADTAAEKYKGSPLLTSLFDLSKFKVEVLKREISNFHQPITLTSVPNFSGILAKWLEQHADFQLFTSQLSNHFGRFHTHELKAALVLNLTQLEAIASDLGTSKESEKYDLPLRHYGHTGATKLLCSVMSATSESDIGKMLSALRGEVAHIGRPAKLLAKIGDKGFLKVVLCLRIVIATHIYTKLGIPAENIMKFQRRQFARLF